MSAECAPFLRWAGGKRWIAGQIAPLLKPLIRSRYIEPFLGSGAMFFRLCPERAVLGDLNLELINTYRQVRDNASELERALRQIPVNRQSYNSIRSSHTTDAFDSAVRFIYLNRTCYGGLYRTNTKGVFNVPYGGGGRTPEVIYRDHLLVRASATLQGGKIDIRHSDFEFLVDLAEGGDLVFCDPTYRSAGRGRFDRYGPNVFSWNDQRRLAVAAEKAESRGAVVVIMNIDDAEIRLLYHHAAAIVEVARKKSIGNAAKDDSWHREIIAVFGGESSRNWGTYLSAANEHPRAVRNQSVSSGSAIAGQF